MADQAAQAVVVAGAVQAALAALAFAMQVVSLEVADDLPIDIDLVQVAAAVVQVVDGAAIGQHGRCAVAQRVVAVGQRGGYAVAGGGFLRQAAQRVVAELDVAEGVFYSGQLAQGGVLVAGGGFANALLQHAPSSVALVVGGDGLWLAGGVGFAEQLAGGVVLVVNLFAVKAGFFHQSVALVVAKGIGCAVFINESGQALGAVVFVLQAVAQRVDSFDGQTINAQVVLGGLACRVGVGYQAGRICK